MTDRATLLENLMAAAARLRAFMGPRPCPLYSLKEEC